MYIYQESDPKEKYYLYSVGFYRGNHFHLESGWETKELAQQRVSFLNGNFAPKHRRRLENLEFQLANLRESLEGLTEAVKTLSDLESPPATMILPPSDAIVCIL